MISAFTFSSYYIRQRETHVRGVLVLGQEGDVQKNGQRGRVGGQDDNLGSTTVEGLGSLVGSLLELPVVASRLDQVQDFLHSLC